MKKSKPSSTSLPGRATLQVSHNASCTSVLALIINLHTEQTQHILLEKPSFYGTCFLLEVVLYIQVSFFLFLNSYLFYSHLSKCAHCWEKASHENKWLSHQCSQAQDACGRAICPSRHRLRAEKSSRDPGANDEDTQKNSLKIQFLQENSILLFRSLLQFRFPSIPLDTL